jgi:hypothetical protein
MKNFKKLGIISFTFLALFLFVFLSKIASAEPLATDPGNAPILVAAQEATIPLTANAATGTTEEECPYKLRLRAGALFLHREDNDHRTLVTDSFLGGNELLNASDLDLGFETGTDISLMLQYREMGLELRFFGLQDWSESKGPQTSPGGAVVQYLTPIGNTAYPAEVSAKYNSWLNNGEFNLHWWPCANERYHLLMGVRWIRLSERLGITQDIGPGLNVANYKTTARNRLWGGQIGAEGVLFGNLEKGFSIDGCVKGGYFRNDILTKATISQSILSDVFVANADKNKGTFLGELGIGANYAFTRNIALTVRYQLLWLDQVALAPEQIQNLAPFAGTARSVDTDSVLYHGGCVGLTISF